MVLFLSGIISGIISGLGMGGGVILVAILSYITNFNQLGLQTLNLIYYIPTAIISLIIYLKNKQINYKTSINIISWGVIPTVISAFIANIIDISLLKKIFAIYLIIVSIVIFIKSIKRDKL